jgi:hypothetical protein
VRRTIITIILSVLCLCATVRGQDPNAPPADNIDFSGWILGNSDMLDVRVGVATGLVEWGLNFLYFPQDAAVASHQAIGAWGAVNTPDITLLGADQIPPFWQGLEAAGFADLNLDYDWDNSAIYIMPGAGIRLTPMETMSLRFRVFYPWSSNDEPVGNLDVNALNYSLGLSIQF